CRSCTGIHASDCQWTVATCNIQSKLPEAPAMPVKPGPWPRRTFQILPTIPLQGEAGMDQRATNADDSGSDEPARDPDPSSPRLSRRDFATRFGAGSAAAVGLAWASPHISTIRFARKAAVGSPPPTGSTTTTSTTIGGTEGSISLNTVTPCVGDIC